MSISAKYIFDEIAKGIAADPSLVSKVGGVFHFKINGKSWTVDLKNGKGAVKEGAPDKADCTVTIAESDFVNLLTGQANGQSLFSKFPQIILIQPKSRASLELVLMQKQ